LSAEPQGIVHKVLSIEEPKLGGHNEKIDEIDNAESGNGGSEVGGDENIKVSFGLVQMKKEWKGSDT
jgi:hypothetical protein